MTNSFFNKNYVIGHQRISQTIEINGTKTTHYFAFDGHGSTRVLLNAAMTIAQIFAFDAYGNAIGFAAGEALTEFLYSGEQFDSKIGQQYLRARYYDPVTGIFNRLDPFFGNQYDPLSLHNYLYAHLDPINGIDPTGKWTVMGCVSAIGARLGVSGSSIGAVLLALDKASTAIEVAQIATQFMLTGTVNPMQLLGVMVDILPGTRFFKKIGITVMPLLKHGVSETGKLTKAADGLTEIWKGICKSPGTKIQRNVSGLDASEIAQSNRLVERIGEIGAGITARKMGFEPVIFKPLRNGIDGIFKKGDQWIIVEAKGGVSVLGQTVRKEGQMSQTWIEASIKELSEYGKKYGDQSYIKLAEDIDNALQSGKLYGMVTTTTITKQGSKLNDLIDATIDEPEYVFKAWDQIGKKTF
ncbi:MAG: hypothetical protein LBG58_09780 [Planctomycetaceae bacterium]|nr:hypothetical protein [Planctomycetaceae bacterium]